MRGTGERMLDLNYISNAEEIHDGEIVLTSGLDGIFPKGFLIGEVVDPRKSQRGFYDIEVQPIEDFLHIEEVSILLMEP